MRNSTLTSKAFPFGQVRSHIAVIAVRSASAVCIFCSGLLDFHFLSFGPSRLDFLDDALPSDLTLMLFASQAVKEINMKVTACQGLGLSINEFAPLAMPKPVTTPLT